MIVIKVSDENVEKLMKIEESDFIDIKSIEIVPSKLTNTVSALANSYGGEIYIGIEEVIGNKGKERKWNGFEDIESLNSITQTLESLSNIGGLYDYEYLKNDNNHGIILHLTIHKTVNTIKATNGKVYIRKSAQNLPVEGIEALKRLEYEKGLFSFEDSTIQCDISSISDSYAITEFIIETGLNVNPIDWLKKQQLIKNDLPIVASVLLFADEPQAIIPKRSGIKILRYQTKSDAERDMLVFDPISIEGCAIRQIYTAVDKCKEIIEEIKKLTPVGLITINYPEEALHENNNERCITSGL